MISKISYRLEANVLHTYHEVLASCVLASQRCHELHPSHPDDYDPTPIWVLPFVFERLVLGPSPHLGPGSTPPSINQLVSRRLRLFRSGQIRLLYEESNSVISRTPSAQSNSPQSINRAAQAKADSDSPKSACDLLTKQSPVVQVDDSNIGILERLHPPSLNVESPRARRHTRAGRYCKRKFILPPKAIIKILGRLNRGKSCGPELDSLDIFIKLASSYRRAKKKSRRTPIQVTTLAKFFNLIINGDVPERAKTTLRTTYLVGLHKDDPSTQSGRRPVELPPVRPINIPSAIRRIAAISVLFLLRGQFASTLLPLNYAFGVHGGVDFITTTMRLGVEKYITAPERDEAIPTRSLVSLDIRNMFNAVSRQKLCSIISHDFPELEAFADLLYSEPGCSKVKRCDGTWTDIPVYEGFSQGCPASPLFAALVLNHILIKCNRDLSLRAALRFSDGRTLDDGQGGAPLILGYVDDVNALLPTEDVEFFLTKFKEYGEPLGAILNTEKTRILTSTSSRSTVQHLLSSWNSHEREAGTSLQRAINTFSRKRNDDGTYSPHEVTTGLRVLGCPIGSSYFCKNFISQILEKARAANASIIAGLSDDQTILQLLKICTSHKMTHLFASDVISSDVSTLPASWSAWESDMVTSFTNMLDSTIAEITRQPTLPHHSSLIASLPTRHGGLGLPHPSTQAIPNFILTTKRSISYGINGIWIGHCHPLVQLPFSIHSLYDNWRSSQLTPFTIFRQYYPALRNICVSERMPNQDDFFLFRSSLNTCRERINNATTKTTLRLLRTALADDQSALNQLDDILCPHMSTSLVDMPRSNPANRRRNEDFSLMIKRKLRLPLWGTDPVSLSCACGRTMDPFGDHCFHCRSHPKTTLSNKVRDGLASLLSSLLREVNLIATNASVTTEPTGIVRALPSLRPFDICIHFDHVLDNSAWRTPLSRLGFDVTITPPCHPPLSNTSLTAAQPNQKKLRLQEGERMKFQRNGKTDQDTMMSLSGDEIIGDIIHNNMALIPIPVTPHGSLGALFNRFLTNTKVGQPPSFSASRPNAIAAYDIARSRLVPKGLFQHADRLWQQHNPETAHSGSYKAYTPSANYNQRIGLILSTSISSHLKRCYHKNAHAREQRIIQNVSHSYTTMRNNFTALQHAISDLSPDHLPSPATDNSID